jgi:hypothetical protein
MLVDVMIICSLITVAPYYDCDEKWAIHIYDDNRQDYPCATIRATACVLQPSFIYWSAQAFDSLWYDACGHGLFLHEINHLKYKDPEYCHY